MVEKARIIALYLPQFHPIPEKAKTMMMPMQRGDVYWTYADTTALKRDFRYCPKVALREEVERLIEWYNKFFI
jgi:UDP-glucuronate 4-epimerase